jgi:hypothetical protein
MSPVPRVARRRRVVRGRRAVGGGLDVATAAQATRDGVLTAGLASIVAGIS